MLEVTAFCVIALLYIIPLNLLLYYLSQQTVMNILLSQNSVVLFVRSIPGLSAILQGNLSIAAAFFYVLYVLLIFAAFYLVFRFIIVKSLYVYQDNEVEAENLLLKYKRGQRNINAFSNIAIILVLAVHIFLKVFDIKIMVLGFLCLIFVFRKAKARKVKKVKTKQEEVKISEEEVSSTNSLVYEWYYRIDPLGIQQSVRFSANVSINSNRYAEYQSKEHLDNSPASLREHVLDGICPEIVELAKQIKQQCTSRGFTTFHQASTVMAFQQSLKYVYDMDSKGYEEYVRYPLETLVDKEGDCDCHGICSAAILFSMGYDVVLLRIVFPEGDGHLAMAVEGADGIPGNFFELNGRKYYYCEVTPSEGSSMNFKVGEMPDMPGANITVVPVKEIVNNL